MSATKKAPAWPWLAAAFAALLAFGAFQTDSTEGTILERFACGVRSGAADDGATIGELARGFIDRNFGDEPRDC